MFEAFDDQFADFQLAFALSFCRSTVFHKSGVFKNHLIQSLHGEIYIHATPAEIIETVKKVLAHRGHSGIRGVAIECMKRAFRCAAESHCIVER
jgi:hypothetical protein